MPALRYSNDRNPKGNSLFVGDKPKSLAELETLNRLPETTGPDYEIRYIVFSITVGSETKHFMRLGKLDESHTPIAAKATDECALIGKPSYEESGSMKVIDKKILLNTYYGKTEAAERILNEEVCKSHGFELAAEKWIPSVQ